MAAAQTSVGIDADVPAWQDRADRLRTILMVGRIITPSGDHLCRIRNISSGGMLVECEARLAVHQQVMIELRNLNVVTAQVRWMREGRVGVQFKAPIEVADLLQRPSGLQLRPRSPRLGVSCPVVLWRVGLNRRAMLIDVSQTGCRLEVIGKLAVCDDVRITIPGLPSRHATVRWIDGGIGGFSFNEPLPFADLMAWDSARER